MIHDVHTVLMVEDDDNDAYFIERVLKKLGYRGEIRRCEDGAEAIAYLSGEGKFADRTAHPKPELVITDLKMPGTSGLEFLRWVKRNPEAMVIPTVVLSSSNEPADVREAYCLGANAYMMKPGHMAELEDIMQRLLNFWKVCERLPGAGMPPRESKVKPKTP